MNYPPPKLIFFKNCLWVNNYWCYVIVGCSENRTRYGCFIRGEAIFAKGCLAR